MTEQMDGQVSWLDQGTWFGKTYQEHSAQTKEQTYKLSSRKSSVSQSQLLPLCLCLQKSGARADASTMSWGGWSVAWRVHDAQFWGATQYVDGRVWHRGTPQRRKRIALVADFGGLTAAEILFVKKGLHGDFAEIREEGQGTSTDIERSIGESDK